MKHRHQEFRTIPFNLIDVPEWLRRPLDPRRHVRLMESVADHGITETVRVRPLPDGRYQLMDGFRRYLAERAQGASTLEVLLHEGADEVTALARAIFSEEHRGGRSTLERAWLIKELQDALKRAGRPHAQKDIHQRIWASKGTISELLDLAELFPRDRLEAAAAERGVSLHRVHGLKRSVLRALRDEPLDAARIGRAIDAALEGKRPREPEPIHPLAGLRAYLDANPSFRTVPDPCPRSTRSSSTHELTGGLGPDVPPTQTPQGSCAVAWEPEAPPERPTHNGLPSRALSTEPAMTSAEDCAIPSPEKTADPAPESSPGERSGVRLANWRSWLVGFARLLRRLGRWAETIERRFAEEDGR